MCLCVCVCMCVWERERRSFIWLIGSSVKFPQSFPSLTVFSKWNHFLWKWIISFQSFFLIWGRHLASYIFTTLWLCYIYIYSHPQTGLFRSIRTHQCDKTVSSRSWDRNPVDSNAKPKVLTIQPRGHFKRLWITITIVYIHTFNGSRDLNSNEEACNRR